MWVRGIVHSVHKLLQYGDSVTCDRPCFYTLMPIGTERLGP